jgi:hypothetical protein
MQEMRDTKGVAHLYSPCFMFLFLASLYARADKLPIT